MDDLFNKLWLRNIINSVAHLYEVSQTTMFLKIFNNTLSQFKDVGYIKMVSHTIQYRGKILELFYEVGVQ